jgi:hypothetical protein
MFVIYGVSKAKAVQAANKSLSMYDEKGRSITAQEYAGQLAEKSAALMARMKPSKISPVYSSKELAKQFKDMAHDSAAAIRMEIMRAAKTEVDPKTKKEKIVWQRC